MKMRFYLPQLRFPRQVLWTSRRWDGYPKRYSQYEFDLWNSSSLSKDILSFLLNETIFFEDARNKMRRTLVVLSDINYDLSHFKLMIDELLLDCRWSKFKKTQLEHHALKVLTTILVCLNMIYEYSKENNNLTHALVATEYCLLKCWHFIQCNKINKSKKIIAKHAAIFNLYYQYSDEYFKKISAHCFVKDAITIGCYERVTASEVVFKQIGWISTFGLIQFSPSNNVANDTIANTLMSLIDNNSVSSSPPFDALTIEISLAVFFLALSGKHDFIKKWINEIITRFHFSYVLYGKGFPLSYNTIDKLIEFEYENKYRKEEMLITSSLLPTLAYWCALLNLSD